MKIKVKSYKQSGDQNQEYFFDSIQPALEKYIEIRNSIPNFWKRQSQWPTIWINTEEGFRRVHDFAFSELTAETTVKYLNERIIDTDDLLATV